jgi:hypothetical protein
MTNQPLPQEINDLITACHAIDMIDLAGKTVKLSKVSSREQVGACPVCGGTDRLHVQKDGYFCRKCHGPEHWHDQIEWCQSVFGDKFFVAIERLIGKRSISSTEMEKIRQDMKRFEAERLAAEYEEMIEARRRLTASRCWERYYANLKQYPEGRRMWNDRGIDDRWIDYWKLGYDPEHTFYPKEKPAFTSPTLTIPYWKTCFDGTTFTYQVIGLRHRLLMADPPGGKYRPELAHLGNNLFVTDLSFQGLGDTVLLVEGEIKAMVTWSAFWIGNTLLMPGLDVVGTAGEGVKGALRDELRTRKMVYICLDPDCYIPPSPCPKTWRPEPERLADDLGRERCKIIRLPGKVDDLLTAGVMDGADLMGILQTT